jgi:hypothetical protein
LTKTEEKEYDQHKGYNNNIQAEKRQAVPELLPKT